MTRILVGIPTRGNRAIMPLLSSAKRQGADSVFVVCNAEEVPGPLVTECEAMAVPLYHEPRVGYASVRNRILDEARACFGGRVLLAMIDDDELPHDEWLSHLVRCQNIHDASAVVGSVRRIWDRDVPRYIQRANLPRRYLEVQSGTQLNSGITGNCLIDVTRTKHIVFNAALDSTGSEDAAYFREIHNGGGRIVYCAEAIVGESVSARDVTPRQLMQRAWRNGVAAPSALGTRQSTTLYRNWRRIPKSFGLFLAGSFLLRRDLLLRAGWELAYVIGILSATPRK